MKFAVTEVDARYEVHHPGRKTILIPLISKTLPGYGAGLTDESGKYTEELGRKWSKARNSAMKSAILADPTVQAEVAGGKVLSYAKTCSCGCSGGFKVEGKTGWVVFVTLEQTE